MIQQRVMATDVYITILQDCKVKSAATCLFFPPFLWPFLWHPILGCTAGKIPGKIALGANLSNLAKGKGSSEDLTSHTPQHESDIVKKE